MFNIDIKEDLIAIKADILNINKRLDIVETHDAACDAKHSEHDEYRRSTDSKIDGVLKYQRSSDETLKEILGIIKDHLPTMKRAKDAYTFADILMKLAGVVTLFIGAYLAILHLVN